MACEVLHADCRERKPPHLDDLGRYATMKIERLSIDFHGSYHGDGKSCRRAVGTPRELKTRFPS
jgi:hypothetical protein